MPRKVAERPRRIFRPGVRYADCPYNEPYCWVDFRCQGCGYEALLANDQVPRPELWRGYSHPRPTQPPSPVVASSTTEYQPSEPGAYLRTLASGTVVEVSSRGRVLRTIKEHQ